jgi:NAD(P)-dependent dehydrogenase (short-subunit alcohol dehydrogenase family)
MSESTLGGRVAQVTGAASEIGRATALELASSGVGVAGVDIDAVGLAEMLAWSRSGAHAPWPSTRTSHAWRPLSRPWSRWRPSSVRWTSSSTPPACSARTTSSRPPWRTWTGVFAINLRAPFLLMQSVAAGMVERGEGGRIVKVTSSSAFRAPGVTPAYAGSKAALRALTRVAAASSGYTTSTSTPSSPASRGRRWRTTSSVTTRSSTAALARVRSRTCWVSEPEDVAAVSAFLCRPESRQITRQMIHTSAGTIV